MTHLSRVLHYHPIGHECALFDTAQANRLPLLLKGPTGCGKTRFVEHMAAKTGRKLYTVACHDDPPAISRSSGSQISQTRVPIQN